MDLRSKVLVSLLFLALFAPAVPGYHSAGNGVIITDTGTPAAGAPYFTRFYVPLATPVWWDHSTVRGQNTGLHEQNHMFELNFQGAAGEAVVTADAVSATLVPDLECVDPGPNTPTVWAGVAIVHPVDCLGLEAHTVQIHYFPWETAPSDPDHVLSPTTGNPLAVLLWRADAVAVSHKQAVIPSGHWQVWIDPGVSPGDYFIEFRMQSTTPVYYDYLGTRGCPFYSGAAPNEQDVVLLGCQRSPNNPTGGNPNGYV